MNPQLVPKPNLAAPTRPDGDHLTELQFGELLGGATGPDTASAEAHLLTCEHCASELALMRESLSLFCLASSAYADSELRHIPQVSLPSRRIFSPEIVPTWWIAAAAILLAAILPMQISHSRISQTAPGVAANTAGIASQSDEALLEDVDRDTSASVPAPMQTLADPTDSVALATIDPSVPTSTQRKD